MYIRSQDREKLYRFDGNYGYVEYDTCQKTDGKTLHKLYISGGNSEEIGIYETRERCLEIIDEIQKVCVSYLYSEGSVGLLRGMPAFPPFAAEIPRIYEMPEK